MLGPRCNVFEQAIELVSIPRNHKELYELLEITNDYEEFLDSIKNILGMTWDHQELIRIPRSRLRLSLRVVRSLESK